MSPYLPGRVLEVPLQLPGCPVLSAVISLFAPACNDWVQAFLHSRLRAPEGRACGFSTSVTCPWALALTSCWVSTFELKPHYVRLTSLWQLRLAIEGVSVGVRVAPVTALSPRLGREGGRWGRASEAVSWAPGSLALQPEGSRGSWDPVWPEDAKPIFPPPQEAIDQGPFLVTLIVKTKTRI